jgi:small-conductance mechanosensitive channel
MLVQTWGDVLTTSFQDVWLGVARFLPNLVVAVIIVILGWLIGAVIGKAIWQIFRSIRVDEALKKTGFEDLLRRSGTSLDSGAFVGGLVKWFIIVVFFIAAFEVLGLHQVNAFLSQVVLGYLPQVIVAVLVLLVAGIVGDVVQRLVNTTARAAEIRSAHTLGTLSRWSIWIFGLLVALSQLGIGVQIIQTLFMGVVVALSLAFGLSFGLGGQEAASQWIDKARSEMHGR